MRLRPNVARRARALILPTALAATAPAAARAQTGGTFAVPLLALPASPRAGALADAVGALGGDPSAVFASPGQLATLRVGAAASVERLVTGTTLMSASAAGRLLGGTASVGVQALGYPEVAEVRDDFVETGRTVDGGDFAVSAGWGRAVGGRGALRGLRVGVVGKLARQRVAEAAGSAGAGDVGLAWTAPAADRAGASLGGLVARALAGTTVAAAVQHVGGELSLLDRASPLPRRARVAVARPFALGQAATLLALGEVSQLRGERARAAGGTELRWRVGRVALEGRAGVRQRLRGEALDAATVGGGLAVGGVALDYAYQGYGGLGSTHRLGVRWAR